MVFLIIFIHKNISISYFCNKALPFPKNHDFYKPFQISFIMLIRRKTNIFKAAESKQLKVLIEIMANYFFIEKRLNYLKRKLNYLKKYMNY